VSVNGHETQAIVETSTNCYLNGPLSFAKECGMQLEAVHSATGGPDEFRSKINIKYLGVEESDAIFWVKPECLGEETIFGNALLA